MIHQLKFKPVTEASNNEPNTFYESLALKQYIADLTDSYPVEVDLIGDHISYRDCTLLTPDNSTREIVFLGNANTKPRLISSYRWMEEQHGANWNWSQNAKGNWVRETHWYGSQAQTLFKRNELFVGRESLEFQTLVNWESASITFEAPNKIKAQNIRLDNFGAGRVIHVTNSEFNNRQFTVISSTAGEILTQETVVDENNFNVVDIRADELLPGEYFFETSTPTAGRCRITAFDEGEYSWGHQGLISAVKQSNVIYHGIDTIGAASRVAEAFNTEIIDCSFDYIAGKAIISDGTAGYSRGIKIDLCRFTDVIEGFYSITHPHQRVDDILMQRCLFDRINHTIKNKHPAPDGHAMGTQNGSDHIAKDCVARNIQGVAFANYPLDGPEQSFNCGYENIVVDNVKEFIPTTSHSIEGINLSGDTNINVGGRYITGSVVMNVDGEAIRAKTDDIKPAVIAGNFSVDNKTGYRIQKILGKSSFNFIANQATGNETNIHITNTIEVDKIHLDWNVYEEFKDYNYKRINQDFDQYKLDIQEYINPLSEVNSIQIQDDGEVRRQANLRIKAIEAAIE